MSIEDVARAASRPQYYHRDGTPFVYHKDLGLPEVVQWAMMFEAANRTVRQTTTLYGERLSTVFLGLDHQFGDGPPIIFETMLFAPKSEEQRDREHKNLHSYAAACKRSVETGEELQLDEDEQTKQYDAWVEKNFPHDQLQLRYSTEQEAIDSHNKLGLQCLIPPRWRRLLCYEIGEDETWR